MKFSAWIDNAYISVYKPIIHALIQAMANYSIHGWIDTPYICLLMQLLTHVLAAVEA